VRIGSVRLNNRKRAFEFVTPRGAFSFPYAMADPEPLPSDPVKEIFIDEELAGEAVTYRLTSGAEGFVHVEMVFDYNREPAYLRDGLLYRLTLEAQRRLEQSGIAKREVIRRLETSPAQLYRLLDQANYDKSVDRMLELLSVLGCEVELSVRPRTA